VDRKDRLGVIGGCLDKLETLWATSFGIKACIDVQAAHGRWEQETELYTKTKDIWFIVHYSVS
jgi:hypothetical protein